MSEEKKRETVRTAEKKAADPVAEHEAWLHEEVEIELFYDGDKYKDDVVVGVNGKTWLIKRGERVRVPRYVAEVIANSEAQDKHAARISSKFSTDFEREAKKLLQE